MLAGKTPWALPLKIRTHSVVGMVALRALAGLKWLRVRGSRYANEQAMLGTLAGLASSKAAGATGGWATRSPCAAA